MLALALAPHWCWCCATQRQGPPSQLVAGQGTWTSGSLVWVSLLHWTCQISAMQREKNPLTCMPPGHCVAIATHCAACPLELIKRDIAKDFTDDRLDSCFACLHVRRLHLNKGWEQTWISIGCWDMLTYQEFDCLSSSPCLGRRHPVRYMINFKMSMSWFSVDFRCILLTSIYVWAKKPNMPGCSCQVCLKKLTSSLALAISLSVCVTSSCCSGQGHNCNIA